MSSCLLSKNIKIKIYRTTVFPVVLYGFETWSLTLGEECRLRMFEKGVLGKTLGPKRDKVTWEWRNYIMRSLMISTPLHTIFG